MHIYGDILQLSLYKPTHDVQLFDKSIEEW